MNDNDQAGLGFQKRGTARPFDGMTALFIALNGNSPVLDHGIVASRMERMTFGQAFQPQPKTFGETIDLNGFMSVLGTCGSEPATGALQRRDEKLIKTDQTKTYRSDHELRPSCFTKTRRSSLATSVDESLSAPCRAMITISRPGKGI